MMNIKLLFYSFVVSILSFNNLFSLVLEPTPDYQLLDTLGLISGTDKASNHHDYTKIYSHYFEGFKNKPIKFLEIGIYRGDSVKMWEAYFPNAELFFIDISAQYIEYYSPRAQYFFLDQTRIHSSEEFSKVVTNGFDVIIDDGGHTMKQQISSFVSLFPHLKSGGMYIIEDLHTSYWRAYGGHGTQSRPKAGKGTTIAFLKDLLDSMNKVGAMTSTANHHLASQDLLNTLNIWEKEILSMHFYDSVCIIFKR